MHDSRLPFFVRLFAAMSGAGGGESTHEEEDVQEASEGGDAEDEGVDEKGDAEEQGDADPEDEGVDELGDAGKQALNRMKEKWRAERDRRKQLEAKYEPPKSVGDDVLVRAHQKILRSEIKAAAAGKFKDPADAYRFLDLEQFEVSEAGDVDEDEISDAIAAVLAEKPYLAVAQSEPRFQGNADGGYRKDSTPSQLSRSDLGRMSPAAILEAEQQGRLDGLKGIRK